MARVLVTMFSHLARESLDSFREGFVGALLAAGNEVLLLRSEDFMRSHFASNQLREGVDEAALNGRIGEFAPEVVLSFNHSGLYESLLAVADVPIGVWLVDGPAYLVDREVFTRQAERYRVFLPSRAFIGELRDGYGLPASSLSWLPFCSDFRAEEVEQTVPVCFIGTFFHTIRFPKKVTRHHASPETWERLRLLVESYRTDAAAPFSDRLARWRLEEVLGDAFDEAGLLNTLSLNRRLHVLEAVADLGLQIYGNDRWLEVLPYSMDLVFAFRRDQVQRRRELEALYNRSRLALSISHIQARGGLPWRVFDILATNAVLVSDQQPDLRELFPGLSLPVYESPAEAREICRRLLGDDGARRGLAAAGQAAVEAGHRFRHRLAQMGEELGVNLLPGGAGACRRLDERALARAGASSPPTEQGTRWPFKVMYSATTRFTEQQSVREWRRLVEGDRVEIGLRVGAAPEFLRIDPGEAFSAHRHPVLRVRRLGPAPPDPEEAAVEIDLASGGVGTADLRVEDFSGGRRLVCGSDPRFVFRNPFPGHDIEVRFTSVVEAML
ncbi:MAG: glycosyltransferase [Actinobacteria bacterium]|nr:glycosyltransferase [Actinomycetota bacterium]